MILKPIALATTMLVLSAGSAFAVSCYGSGNGSSVSVGIGFQFGEFTEQDSADHDLWRLRNSGVDASSVEYWGGCIRAWVRNEDGPGEHMEFYHPRTLERVD